PASSAKNSSGARNRGGGVRKDASLSMAPRTRRRNGRMDAYGEGFRLGEQDVRGPLTHKRLRLLRGIVHCLADFLAPPDYDLRAWRQHEPTPSRHCCRPPKSRGEACWPQSSLRLPKLNGSLVCQEVESCTPRSPRR